MFVFDLFLDLSRFHGVNFAVGGCASVSLALLFTTKIAVVILAEDMSSAVRNRWN